jgi:hypothetical protein
MKPLTIGQVVNRAGVGVETNRFYERHGTKVNAAERRLVDGAAEAGRHRNTSAWARTGLLRLAEKVLGNGEHKGR